MFLAHHWRYLVNLTRAIGRGSKLPSDLNMQVTMAAVGYRATATPSCRPMPRCAALPEH
jgi:hypothetical protein